jgi:hypothetical protein
MVARKEASMGCPSIHPPCISSLHRSLSSRQKPAEPPKPPNGHPPQLAAAGQERQQDARRREGPTNVEQATDYDNHHERDEVRIFRQRLHTSHDRTEASPWR